MLPGEPNGGGGTRTEICSGEYDKSCTAERCCQECSERDSCAGWWLMYGPFSMLCYIYSERFDTTPNHGPGEVYGFKTQPSHHCTAPDNCYHVQWAVPCSDAANKAACEASNGVWEGSPSPSPSPTPTPTPPPTPTPTPSPTHHCTPPDDCYHEQWGVPCSFAGTEERCVQSGGVWEGGASPTPSPVPTPTPPPTPTPSPTPSHHCTPPDDC